MSHRVTFRPFRHLLLHLLPRHPRHPRPTILADPWEAMAGVFVSEEKADGSRWLETVWWHTGHTGHSGHTGKSGKSGNAECLGVLVWGTQNHSLDLYIYSNVVAAANKQNGWESALTSASKLGAGRVVKRVSWAILVLGLVQAYWCLLQRNVARIWISQYLPDVSWCLILGNISTLPVS